MDTAMISSAAQAITQSGVGTQTQPQSAAGFFDLLLQQMTGGEGQAEGLTGLLELFSQTQQQEESKKGYELAAQMVAQGFFMIPQPGQLAELMTADGVMLEPETGQGLQTNGLPLQQMMANSLFSQQQATSARTEQIAFFAAAATPTQELEAFEVLQAGQANPDGGQSGDAQSEFSFFQLVSEAKKQLGSETDAKRNGSKDEFRLDVERLQQEVDAGKYSAPLQAQKLSARAPLQSDLLAQVKAGLTRGLGRGDNEFVIKLKPEGLGEITVKLIEADSKISMSIIASNAQTAKILGNDIEALRDSLRPYHADLREVVDQQQYASSDDGQRQGFSGQQHFGGHRQTAATLFEDLELVEDELLAPDSELNIYI